MNNEDDLKLIQALNSEAARSFIENTKIINNMDEIHKLQSLVAEHDVTIKMNTIGCS